MKFVFAVYKLPHDCNRILRLDNYLLVQDMKSSICFFKHVDEKAFQDFIVTKTSNKLYLLNNNTVGYSIWVISLDTYTFKIFRNINLIFT